MPSYRQKWYMFEHVIWNHGQWKHLTLTSQLISDVSGVGKVVARRSWLGTGRRLREGQDLATNQRRSVQCE